MGDLTIEVKDGKWHVSKVDCLNHNCEKMGWVDADSILPIQCIPNGIYIYIYIYRICKCSSKLK